MNCLFILANNYPYSGACTSLLNNLFFEGDMLKNIETIDVLACKGDLISEKKACFNEVTVYNCNFWSYASLAMCRNALKNHPIKAIKGFIKKTLVKIDHSDIKRCNVRSVYAALKSMDAQKYDVIVAVMGAFEVAAAAMKFKKNNPDVKLVIYQVDPCSTNESCLDSTKNERESFEKELYFVSDRIITTPILIDEAKKIYSKDIIKKMVSLEFPNVVPKKCENHHKCENIRCVFAGNIYGGIRNPQYTWRLFDETEPCIGLEMMGSIEPEIKRQIKYHKVRYMGSKGLKETQSELATTDILVNIGNSMTNQVPSKLFEYISYGKPIINICKNRNCPTMSYLSNHKYVLNLYEEEDVFEEQVKKLNSFILKNYKNRMTSEEIISLYETCTPQYCAKQMMCVFNQLIKSDEGC